MVVLNEFMENCFLKFCIKIFLSIFKLNYNVFFMYLFLFLIFIVMFWGFFYGGCNYWFNLKLKKIKFGM